MIHSTLFCELSFHFEPNIKPNKIWQNFRKHILKCVFKAQKNLKTSVGFIQGQNRNFWRKKRSGGEKPSFKRRGKK
jgi:adenosine deaminase